MLGFRNMQEKLEKVPFFQKVRFVFQISQSPKKIIPKNYPDLEIWISCLPIWAGISNFKLRIVFWNDFFGRLGGLKNKSHFFWKKATFTYFIVFIARYWIWSISLQFRKKSEYDFKENINTLCSTMVVVSLHLS